jgi:hypothetical protein
MFGMADSLEARRTANLLIARLPTYHLLLTTHVPAVALEPILAIVESHDKPATGTRRSQYQALDSNARRVGALAHSSSESSLDSVTLCSCTIAVDVPHSHSRTTGSWPVPEGQTVKTTAAGEDVQKDIAFATPTIATRLHH